VWENSVIGKLSVQYRLYYVSFILGVKDSLSLIKEKKLTFGLKFLILTHRCSYQLKHVAYILVLAARISYVLLLEAKTNKKNEKDTLIENILRFIVLLFYSAKRATVSTRPRFLMNF